MRHPRPPFAARPTSRAFLATLLALAVAWAMQACTDRTVVAVDIGVITIQPGVASLQEGESLQFRAVVEDASGRALPRATVVWSSEAPDLLAIDGSGVGEALAPGDVAVRATFRGVSGTATVHVIAAPRIQLRRDTVPLTPVDTLRFLGAAGAQSPAAQVLQVRNSGGGTLGQLQATVEFGVGQPDLWLTPLLAGIEDPTTLTVTPQTAVLPIGMYDARITVTSPDAEDPFVLAVKLSLMDYTVTESDGGTSVAEAGGTDDFTVALAAAPESDVVIDVSVADTTEIAVAPRQLTFTPADWDQPRTVTVTGLDEVTADGDRQTDVILSVVDSISDDTYDPIPDKTVSVTAIDDDVAAFSVVESDGGTTVSEAGSQDSFTVVLDARPVTAVVFDVVSRDTTEVRVSPTSLRFDGTDWDTPKSVTVTGVQDALVDGAQITAVTVGVNAGASDDAFDGLAPDTVLATTTDDDSAGFTVVEPDGVTQVNEVGSTDQFTVVLTAQPVSNVVIAIANPDPGEVSLSAPSLTFTPANWGTTQTVTVTGVDDELNDGNQTTVLTLSVDAAQSDDDFDGLPSVTVTVTTADDDTPGFSVTESGGGTSVTEAGTTDDFQVVLQSEPQPGTVVVMNVTSLDQGEVAASPATLTFNPANWLIPQVVTVTGQDELIDDGDRVTDVVLSVDAVLSDADYAAVPPDTVRVTTIDDDVASFTLTETGGGTLVTEAGATDDFTVVLGSQPVTDVVLAVLSLDEGEVTVSPASLTFTPANWNVAQTVTVTGEDDLENDGDQFTLVAVSVVGPASDDAYDPLPDQSVNVTTTDNDSSAGLVVTVIAGTIVAENGTLTDDFTVALETQPATNVVVNIVSQDPTEVAVSPTRLTFIPSLWNVPQTVVVTGVDDFIIDGDVQSTIALAVDDAASDDTFDGVATSIVATTLDNDVAGLTVTQVGGTSVTEAGSTDDFTVQLTAQPASNVVVAVTSGDTGEVTVAPGLLTFTPANWSAPQTVTVTGVDDAEDDGDQTTTITIAVQNASSDDDFDNLTATVLVRTFDDDGVGLTITEQGSTSVTEAGSQDTFTIRLNAQPVANVFLDIVSTDTGEATVAPIRLTFTPANWSTPQTVTVTGVNDFVDDGDQETPITVTVDVAASDPAYGIVQPRAVLATTVDDDTASFILANAANTTVTEAGSSDPFTVVLGAQPLSNVVINVTSADIVEATVSPGQLTFTPGNWNVAQTVTVTGGDDLIDDGDQITIVTVAVNAGSSDDTFDPLPPQTVSVTTVDDDTAGLTLAGTAGMTVSESGTTADFTIRLDTQPVVNVLVLLSSSDPGEATVTPASITFTPVNWATPRTATVRGVDDALLDGSQAGTVITVAVDAAASDDAYDPLSASFNVTTLDNDVAGFSIQEFGGLRVNESGSSDEFTVVLDAQPSGNVVLDIASANLAEVTVSPSRLIFTPGDWNSARTVTVTGVDDFLDDDDQVTTVTIQSNNPLTIDNAFDNLSRQVLVTTTDDDGVGFTITEIGSTTVPESGLFTDNFTVRLDAQPSSNVVVDVTSSDLTEATVSPAMLTFTPANWNQPQTVTVFGVDDNLIDGDQTTNINVVVRNGASDPVFANLTGVVVATTTDDDVAGFTLLGTAGLTVSEGGTQASFGVVLNAQPVQNVVIDVTSLDVGEVTVAPARLTFTNGDWNVPRTVTLTGIDDALVDGSQVTTIRLQINQALTDNAFDFVPNRTTTVTTLDNDVAGLAVVESNGNTTVSESGTTDTFTVRLAAQPSLNVVVTISSGDPTEAGVAPTAITFTPANWSTPQTITVTGADDLIDDGDQQSVVTIAVDNANSDDAFDNLSATVTVTTLDDDSASFILGNTAGLTVNESGTAAVFNVRLGTQPTSNVVLAITSGDAGEVAIVTPTVTFTPANWNVARNVTVVGVDDVVVDGNQVTTVTIAVDDAASDNAFDPLPDQTVSVTTVDNDVAGLALADTVGLTVSESGTTDDFTVVLTRQPLSNVVLNVSSSDTGEATVSPATLTFTPFAWNVPQTVTLRGVNDDLIDGVQTSTITVAVNNALSDGAFSGLSRTTTVRTTDNDTAGLNVVELGGTTVNESGSTDNFQVSLTAQPASNVVLSVVSEDMGEVTVAPGQLTFTPGNWSTAQVVTVTGVDDFIDDDDQVTRVIVASVNPQTDIAFRNLADTVLVTTTDNDGVGFTITEFGGTQVSETGTTDQFGVALTAQPGTNVVLNVTSTDLGEATVDRAALTFTPGNWSQAQAIVVTGIDDLFVDGDQTTPITVAVNAALSDNAFDLLPAQAVQATTTDDDVAGFLITESGGTTQATEGGANDTFQVVLTRGPVTPVRLTITSASPTEASVSVSSLTFTAANWQTPQTVTVGAVNDVFVDGTRATQITVSVDDPASDPAFRPLADQLVTATTFDNDVAGFSVVQSGGSTVATEGGATDSFTVQLTAGPLTNVFFDVTSANPSEASVLPARLTFTPLNWSTPQTVTVTAQDDPFVDGQRNTNLTVAVDPTASNQAFRLMASQVVIATTNDNDVAGFTITQSGGSTIVPESGATTDAFTVRLNAAPLTSVRLTITSADTGEATAAPAALTFTSANWNVAQTVTVSGVDDQYVDGTQNTNVTVAVDPAQSDAAFAALPSQVVTVQTTDDDLPGFVITETAGGTSVQEVGGSPDTFTVVLSRRPVSPVTLTVTSADTDEVTVSPATLVFNDTNWNVARTVTVTGVDDVFVDGPQATLITVAVQTAGSDPAWIGLGSQTVTATTLDNDVAGFTIAQSGGTTVAVEGGATDAFTVVLNRAPVTPVRLNVTSGDPTEATVSVATLDFSAANWSTPQTVTVTAVNDVVVDGTRNTTITVAVNAPASDPLWAGVGSQNLVATTNDDDVASFTFAATGGNTTVAESGTTDQVTVVLDRAPLTPVQIDLISDDPTETALSPGSLTFTGANWNTVRTVTVTGQNDDIDDDDQVTLIRARINQPATDAAWDLVADRTLPVTTTDDDTAGFTIVESGGSTQVTEAAGPGRTDTFTVRLNSEPTSNVVLSVTSADTGEATVAPSQLTFTPVSWATPQTVTVTGVDDGVVDPGTITLVTVSVVDGLSDDRYDPLPDQTVSVTTIDDETAGLTIVESGGSTVVTEGGTTDTFTVALSVAPSSNVVLNVTSGDPGEATVSVGTLTFTPGNWFTAQTVTVTGINDGVLVDGNQVTTVTISVDQAASPNEWDTLPDRTVLVTTTDDDQPLFFAGNSDPGAVVDENGSTGTFEVVLLARPIGQVQIVIANPDPGEVTIAPMTLVFDNANWNIPQPVTATGVPDGAPDGDQVTELTLSIDVDNTDDLWDAAPNRLVNIRTIDVDGSDR